MIFVDDIKKGVSKSFVGTFTKPVVYELHESQIGSTPVEIGVNKKSYPRSRGIMAFFTTMDKGVTVIWRYAEQHVPKKHAGVQYTQYSPEIINFGPRGQIILDPSVPNHVDLHYFLSLYPRNASSQNFDDSKTPVFYLVDNAATATKQAKIERDKHDAEGFIFNDWDENKLREIAKAFDVFSVDDLSFDEVQIKVLAVMRNNPTHFLERAMSEEMVLRAQITEGSELKLISYDKVKETWYWGENTSKPGEKICTVRQSEDPKDRLIKHWRASIKDDNIEYFVERLEDAAQMKADEIAKRQQALSNKNSRRVSQDEDDDDEQELQAKSKFGKKGKKEVEIED